MKWINILHIYQPPTQSKEIVDKVAEQSYRLLVSLLDKYPRLRLTMNISGSLLELLAKYGHEDILARLKRHADRGAIELLGSAMYHPILPLLEKKEILRQIRLHNAISKKYFGDAYRPSGFYLPEMAYSHEVGNAIAEAGFKWILLDEIHATEKIDFNKKYKVKNLSLGVVFRNSSYSRTFPPESLVNDLNKLNGSPVVTCHDGEMYGHWHEDDRGYYEKAFTDTRIEMLTVSEYLASLSGEELEISVRDASWESRPEELEQNIAHGLWNDPRNRIHRMLEDFKRYVLTLVEERQADAGYEAARHKADRGVASCAWWWASGRKLGPFSPHTWNPTEIEKGARELYDAATSLSLPQEIAEKVSLDFKEIKKAVWEKHKKDYDPGFDTINA